MQVTAKPASGLSELVSIADMSEHDLLEVVEIEELSALSKWGWAAYYAELQGTNRSLMLVARVVRPLEQIRTREVAGYIVARMAADGLHINNVAVRDEYRRRGVGGALLTEILEAAKKLGASVAFLELRAGNTPAQALYEKCGFTVIGRRRNYYSDPVADALTMSAQLNQHA